MTKLKELFEVLCAFVDSVDDVVDVDKDKMLELALILYDVIDPFPNINLDDEIVRVIVKWILDLCYSSDSNLS